MADIRLAKPAAGTTQTVPSAPNGRFIFDFPADAATLTRNGDDLVLTFEDGSSIQLQGFYTTYSKEEMPSFQVEGVEISGQDFFAALGEDLMPAAGPAASSASRSGRYNEYGGSDLLDGIDHLGRLDIGFDGGTQLATDTVEPSAPEVDIDYDVTIAAGPEAGAVDLTVYEGGLAGGSQAGQAATPTTASGSLNINAPDGVASIVIGDVVVYENGKLTGNVVTTDEGTLAVTGYDPVTGKLDFSYTLDRNTTEHDKSDPATDTQISHDLTVTVTDTDGDSDSTTITVNVVDDVPTIESFSHEMSEGDAIPAVGNALAGAVAGADGAKFAWDANQHGHFGTITLNADGTYSYRLDNDNATVKELTDGETLTEEFTYTYTDADGDIAEGKVTITINGKDNGIIIEPTDPAAGSDTVTVYESGLADGSQAGQADAPTTASGSLVITAPDGVASIVIGGIVVFEKGGLTGNTVSTDEGTLAVTGFDPVTGELSFTYELSGNTTEHSGSGMDDISHDLTVTVTDMDGTEVDSTITVNVVDDVPVVTQAAKGDATEAENDTADSTLSGSFGIGFGADGAADAPLSINGATGTKDGNKTTFDVDGGKLVVTDNGDGNYSYEYQPSDPNKSFGEKQFMITATDKDGDSTTVEITVKQDFNPGEVEPGVGDNKIVVDEGTQPEHGGEESHGQNGSGSFIVDLHGEGGTIEVGGWTISITDGVATVSGSAQGVHGVELSNVEAELGADGKWTVNYDYALGGRQEHGADGSATDADLTGKFPITVTDATGDKATGSIDVTVHDDVPVVTQAAKGDATEAENDTADSTLSGSFGIGFGADGAADAPLSINGATGTKDGNKTTFDVDGGKLVVTDNGDGNYSYEYQPSDPNKSFGEKQFMITATDKDGDSTTVEITVKQDFNPGEVEPGVGDNKIVVDEGTQPEHGGEESHGQNGSGSFIVDLHGEGGTIEVGGWTISITDGVATVSGSAQGVHGVELSNVEAELGADGKWTVNYDYALGGRQEHGADGSATDADLTGKFPITVTDATGDKATGSIDVTVHDDVPTISADDPSSTVLPGDNADNLPSGSRIDFTSGSGRLTFPGGEYHLDGWEDNITLSAAKVYYKTNIHGNVIYDAYGKPEISGPLDDGKYYLEYSKYNGWNDESDKGLTVNGGDHDYEIGASHNGDSEAVVIDLNGKLAYGIKVDFGAFYTGSEDGSQSSGGDKYTEKALVTFYKDGKVVDSILIEGDKSGKTTLSTDEILLEGFDKVVISAVDNTENSDFTIQGIDFITKRDNPIIVNEGKVTAESGADGFADDYQEANVKFDLGSMVDEGTLSKDGTFGTITVLIDGQETQVDVKLTEGGSGESILTGTIQGGDQLFTATLDKDGNWTMEQYDQFRVPGEEGQESSNEFDLVFKTEDADGDMTSTTVNVPLEVVDQTINADNEAVSNGNDTIVITGGDGVAGTVAAGDSGGVDVITNVQPGQDYNISIMLDLPGSMKYDLKTGEGSTNSTNPAGSRMEMAVDALESFFQNSIQGHDGTVNIQLVGFGNDFWAGSDDLQITTKMSPDQRQSVYDEFAAILENWQTQMFTEGGDGWDGWGIPGIFYDGEYSQGTNYEAAMEEATAWFNNKAGNGGENLAFFISDGQPTYYQGESWKGDPIVDGAGSYCDQETVQATLKAAQTLQKAGGGVQVNAIGIGTNENDSLHEKAQTILDLIDNTGGSGQSVKTYPYQTSNSDDAWKNFTWSEAQPLILGDSDLVDSKDGLTTALVGGGTTTSTNLADAGDDKVDASDSTSSAIIYGDVMNTDRLLYELKQNEDIGNMVAAIVLAVLPSYGSGSEVFQWLETNGEKLTGTDYAGWTHDDTLKYMLEHAEELGYETRVDADGDFYLVKADGTVLNMDGSEAGIDLDSLTGRDGGDDVITGSRASDTIYGQEGDDLLVGDAPSGSGEGSTVDSIEDTTVASIKEMSPDDLDAFIESVEGTDADGDDRLFGGTGDDVLLGMGGNDYLDGGAGEDTIFGGAGNDVIVYDSNDYLVSGGSGIDFMVSTDSELTMKALLEGTGDGNGPIVKGIEVLLKGEDALSLTSLDQLAKDYGITLDTNAEGKETLILEMDKWTYNKENGVYTSNKGDLTLETNLTPVDASDPDSEAVQQQVFTLEHGNG